MKNINSRIENLKNRLNDYYFLIDNGYKLTKKQRHEFNRVRNEYISLIHEVDDDIMVM